MKMLIEYREMMKKHPIPAFLCCLVWGLAVAWICGNSNRGTITPAYIGVLTIQLIASLTDICCRIIPFKLTVFSLIAGSLLHGFCEPVYTALNYIFSGIIAFAVMKLILLISKNQVGGGDMALLTVTGLFLGLSHFFQILLTSVVLAGGYSALLILAGKAERNTEIPFAPFILLGTAAMAVIYY